MHFIYVSLAVFALWYCFQEGEILGVAQNIKLRKFADPVRDCPVCMVPYWGSVIYWIWVGGSLGDYVITILCAMGLNVVITGLWPEKNAAGYHEEMGELIDAVKKNKNDVISKPTGRKV